MSSSSSPSRSSLSFHTCRTCGYTCAQSDVLDLSAPEHSATLHKLRTFLEPDPIELLISRDDPPRMPRHMCIECAARLNEAAALRQQFRQVNDKFRSDAAALGVVQLVQQMKQETPENGTLVGGSDQSDAAGEDCEEKCVVEDIAEHPLSVNATTTIPDNNSFIDACSLKSEKTSTSLDDPPMKKPRRGHSEVAKPARLHIPYSDAEDHDNDNDDDNDDSDDDEQHETVDAGRLGKKQRSSALKARRTLQEYANDVIDKQGSIVNYNDHSDPMWLDEKSGQVRRHHSNSDNTSSDDDDDDEYQENDSSEDPDYEIRKSSTVHRVRSTNIPTLDATGDQPPPRLRQLPAHFVTLADIRAWAAGDGYLLIQRLQLYGCLPMECSQLCRYGHPLRLCRLSGGRFGDSGAAGGQPWMWRCSKMAKRYRNSGPRKCDEKRSVFKHSIFEGSQLAVAQLVTLVWHWAHKDSRRRTVQSAGMTPKTQSVWSALCREVCFEHIVSPPAATSTETTMIGGPGVWVELYEHRFGVRRHEFAAGSRAPRTGAWVYAGVERVGGGCFMAVLPERGDRGGDALLAAMRRHIRAGSRIVSPVWGAHPGCLQRADFQRAPFVLVPASGDAAAGACDPEQPMWQRPRESRQRELAAFHAGALARYLFRKGCAARRVDPFVAFLEAAGRVTAVRTRGVVEVEEEGAGQEAAAGEV